MAIKQDLEFNQNEDAMKLLLSAVERKMSEIKLGGGAKRIEKLHAEGKMTARERIQYLIDDTKDFFEIGGFAGLDMYQEYGGCPAGGVVTGIGRIRGRQCMIVANDATVKAGAWFPITGKKNLRAQEIAMENRLPIVYLVDSAGGRCCDGPAPAPSWRARTSRYHSLLCTTSSMLVDCGPRNPRVCGRFLRPLQLRGFCIPRGGSNSSPVRYE